MKVLITGITGFVGSHLAELYLNDYPDIQLHGTKKWRSDMENIKHIQDEIVWHDCDIVDATSVETLVRSVKPRIIHHLAAMSYVPHSWLYPVKTMQTNLIGTMNFFEAVRAHSHDTKIQVASSSEVYGIPDVMPINENTPLKPVSPYGVSKAAMDLAAQQYNKSYGLPIYITRAFNHTGPRRGKEFVCSTFCKQVAEIESGLKEPVIKVGNLDSLRDFTDVRDIVKAYAQSVYECSPGIPYNISSDTCYSIHFILNMILDLSKTSSISIKEDPNRMRPSDLYKLEGNSEKFRDATGWTNSIKLSKTLEDLLNYWRKKVKDE